MLKNKENYESEKSPFDICKELHAKIKEYEFSGTTREEVQESLNKAFEELVKIYGQGLVRSMPHSFKHKKDEEGKITYTIEGKFIIYIPEKNKWGEKTK